MKHYRSSIPKAARERVVETFETNGRKRKAEYRLNRKLVGIRYFYETGELEAEIPMQDGRQHGTFYDLSPEGIVLNSALNPTETVLSMAQRSSGRTKES
jgi:antitoxin component YwqK of YwqJK toxin-antitoxin module